MAEESVLDAVDDVPKVDGQAAVLSAQADAAVSAQAQHDAAQAALKLNEAAEIAAAQASRPQEQIFIDLDKSRPYGMVQGDLTKKYFQDGKYFDYAGKLLEE